MFHENFDFTNFREFLTFNDLGCFGNKKCKNGLETVKRSKCYINSRNFVNFLRYNPLLIGKFSLKLDWFGLLVRGKECYVIKKDRKSKKNQ